LVVSRQQTDKVKMGKKEDLDKIAREMTENKALPLSKTTTNLVFGNGNLNAKIMFIGEAPGYWEDQKGIPFVGAAGKLLDQLLALIGLSRKDVFVTNIVKHRPPGNRDPLPEEIAAYKPYLDQEIKIIKPKIIIALGRHAMNLFLGEGKISLEHGRGRIIEYQGEKYLFIPMFHPAAALRNSKIKEQLKDDFKKIPLEIKRLAEPLN